MTIAALTPSSPAVDDDDLACVEETHRFKRKARTCVCGKVANVAHDWVVTAVVSVSEKVAKHANLRGSFRTDALQRVDSLEVYCEDCRRPFDDIADQACEAKADNTHLIGGDPGVRAKRKLYETEGEVVPGPPIHRWGTTAIVAGDGTF